VLLALDSVAGHGPIIGTITYVQSNFGEPEFLGEHIVGAITTAKARAISSSWV